MTGIVRDFFVSFKQCVIVEGNYISVTLIAPYITSKSIKILLYSNYPMCE